MHRKPANFYPKSRVIRSQFSQPSSQVGVACRVDGRHKDLVEVKARRRSKWLADGKWQTLIKHGTQELLTRDLGSSKNRVPKIPWLLFMFPCVYLYIYMFPIQLAISGVSPTFGQAHLHEILPGGPTALLQIKVGILRRCGSIDQKDEWLISSTHHHHHHQ